MQERACGAHCHASAMLPVRKRVYPMSANCLRWFTACDSQIGGVRSYLRTSAGCQSGSAFFLGQEAVLSRERTFKESTETRGAQLVALAYFCSYPTFCLGLPCRSTLSLTIKFWTDRARFSTVCSFRLLCPLLSSLSTVTGPH